MGKREDKEKRKGRGEEGGENLRVLTTHFIFLY